MVSDQGSDQGPQTVQCSDQSSPSNKKTKNLTNREIIFQQVIAWLVKYYFRYYDKKKNNCFEFFYKGKGGNGNQFDTASSCLRKCQLQKEAKEHTARSFRFESGEYGPRDMVPVDLCQRKPPSSFCKTNSGKITLKSAGDWLVVCNRWYFSCANILLQFTKWIMRSLFGTLWRFKLWFWDMQQIFKSCQLRILLRQKLDFFIIMIMNNG